MILREVRFRATCSCVQRCTPRRSPGSLLACERSLGHIASAPHIGVLERLAVIELAAADGVRTYVNPQIVWASADMIRHEEGSVSLPGVTEEIERHARVRMSYQDLSGVEKVEEADGLLSVCFQHEVNQLDGIFWIYRLSRLKRDRVVKRFDKTQRTGARRLNSSSEALSRRRWACRSVTSAVCTRRSNIRPRSGGIVRLLCFTR
jgi:peptide deformylase